MNHSIRLDRSANRDLGLASQLDLATEGQLGREIQPRLLGVVETDQYEPTMAPLLSRPSWVDPELW